MVTQPLNSLWPRPPPNQENNEPYKETTEKKNMQKMPFTIKSLPLQDAICHFVSKDNSFKIFEVSV